MQTLSIDGARYKFVNDAWMEILTPKIAMKRLGISKPTFIKWIKNKTIKKCFLTGEKKRYFITDLEVERVKKQMTADWARGKSKMPKAGK